MAADERRVNVLFPLDKHLLHIITEQIESTFIQAYNLAVGVVMGQDDCPILRVIGHLERGKLFNGNPVLSVPAKPRQRFHRRIEMGMQKSTAYNAAVALAEARQYDEAIAAFAELGDYKDSMLKAEETKNLWSDELYNAALDYYLSDEPISLPNAWNLFNKCPSDYKDTQLYKDEIDDILKSLGGHYEKPKDNVKISATLGNGDDGFRIDYESHYVGSAFITGFNYVDTTIKWLIKDGQAVYGTAEDYPWKFTVTPSENSMTIEGDYEELNGTYTKTRDF